MTVLWMWTLILLGFAAACVLGKRLGLIPVVSQLLLAALALPLLNLLLSQPDSPLTTAELLSPGWVKTLYGASFALLLGAILADVRELRPDREALKLALPSFLLPFACGLVCAVWLLHLEGVAALALGLVFAITAIPVLYLYLRAIDYPPAASRRLLQAAIVIDLACWLLLGLGQGSLHPASLGWTLVAALAPLPLYALGLRAPAAYGGVFLALLFAAEHYRLNALLLGIGFLACLALLKLNLRLPLSAAWSQRLQQYLAVPLILACGVLQVDVQQALQAFEPLHLLVLVALPILSKLLGNWLGLCWAAPSFAGASKWRESLLLNIRGLSEIVFLNLLLSQQLISASLYLTLMLMSLVATLMPALAGLHRLPSNPLSTARRPHAEH
ncbi:sodium:proton antiporter [Pseudomonas sp.]|uniref:sodium:proton antiporter n=1 Tax=Pseudomonas sp. TaxID=306 RepID=UPI0028A5DB25|nr:sodium:proton antiporter [Pseudomonas sp.]